MTTATAATAAVVAAVVYTSVSSHVRSAIRQCYFSCCYIIISLSNGCIHKAVVRETCSIERRVAQMQSLSQIHAVIAYEF
jgi:hypothetical protein